MKFLKTFFSWFGKMMSEDNGNPSSMRFNVTNISIQWVTGITFVLVWISIYHSEYILTLVSMILAALLAALGIKKMQKKDEQDVPIDTKKTEDGK